MQGLAQCYQSRTGLWLCSCSMAPWKPPEIATRCYGYQKYKLIPKAAEFLQNAPVRLTKIKCHRSPAVGKMLPDHFCIVLMLFLCHPAQDIGKREDAMPQQYFPWARGAFSAPLFPEQGCKQIPCQPYHSFLIFSITMSDFKATSRVNPTLASKVLLPTYSKRSKSADSLRKRTWSCSASKQDVFQSVLSCSISAVEDFS